MKKARTIMLLALFTILPFTSMGWIYFHEDIGAEQPLEVTAEVMFGNSGHSISSHSIEIVGTDINIQLFTTEVGEITVPWVTYEEISLEIPALPVGDYTINATIVGPGFFGPSRDFSVPRPVDWGGSREMIFAVDGMAPIYMITNDTFKYIHMQRNDEPIEYIVETCTNLVEGFWIQHNDDITTNITGRAYDEITHTIPTTNSQTFISLNINY